MVKRVRIVKNENRLFILILHQAENIVEIREIMIQTGVTEHRASIIFTSIDEITKQLLTLEDILLVEREGGSTWVCLNYAHIQVTLVRFEELLLQRGIIDPPQFYFDAAKCQYMQIYVLALTNEERVTYENTKIVSVDVFHQ